MKKQTGVKTIPGNGRMSLPSAKQTARSRPSYQPRLLVCEVAAKFFRVAVYEKSGKKVWGNPGEPDNAGTDFMPFDRSPEIVSSKC